MSYRTTKRLFDLLVAMLALIILSPLFLITVVAIWITMGAPVFFRQPRPGYGGKVFKIFKFRTMRNEIDADGQVLPDEQRLTRFGNFLRQSSIDELPELLNVIRGDMSLVGPRPLRVEYLSRYSQLQARRHEVRPGITGWAQVNGRNALEWNKRFEFDIWYVDHYSLGLDLKIIYLTVLKVIKREGISAEGHATMPEFLGNKTNP